MKVDARYLGVNSVGIRRTTRLLHGKEFCVLNGEENLSKEDGLTKANIETLLYTHSATVVQNPGPKTFAVIVGNADTVRLGFYQKAFTVKITYSLLTNLVLETAQ